MSKSAKLIVSVSGIRGVVGDGLTASATMEFARAFGTYLQGRPVAISRDSRPSGEMLYEAAAAGLMSVGCNVYFLSINPTPTVGFITPRLKAAGAMQITASHNPSEYNGIKLFSRNGRVLFAAEGEDVLRIYQRKTCRSTQWHNTGQAQTVTADPSRDHIRQVLAQVDYGAIAKRRFRVLVDANHGAGGPLAMILGAMLGCHVIREGCEPDGYFAHPPEPTEINVANVVKRVVEERCDLGLVLDPDADRLALIDEQGRYVGEELTLALAATYHLRQSKGPVVINMSTSRLVEDLAAQYACPLYRSAVGEANVVGKMLEVNAVFGGEGNGGVIDPQVGLVRDPYIGLALILGLLTETGGTLSDLIAKLPHYHIVKEKHEIDQTKLNKAYEALCIKWPAAHVNRDDGVRLDWPDRWIHVRSSNTEPIVRVIAEAQTQEEAQSLCREAGKVVVDTAQRLTRATTVNSRRNKPSQSVKPGKSKKGVGRKKPLRK